MKQITLKILPGSVEEFGITGDYVRVKSASVPVRVEVENGQVDATIEEGDALNLKPFNRLRVSHSDAAEQTVVLFVGNGTSADGAKVGGSVAINSLPANNGDVSQSSFMATNGGASDAVAENLSRRFLLVQNTHASAVLYVAFGVDATTSNGMRITAGGSLLLDNFVPRSRVSLLGGALLHSVVIAEG